jgi:hypothetical protein
VTANPILAGGENANTVGYLSLDDHEIGHVLIPRDALPRVLAPHRTLLLDIQLQRLQLDTLVTLHPLPDQT